MTSDIQKQLDKYAGGFKRYPQLLATEMRHALERSGQRWRAGMLKRFGGAAAIFPQRKGTNRLSVRSGKLRNSLKVEMGPRQGTKVSMVLASRGVPYAASQEFGAKIKPKTAKWLWIPMAGNVTPTGRTRKTPRLLMNQKENLYFHKVKGKKAMIVYLTHKWSGGGGRSGGARSRTKQRKMVAMFYLKKSVTIPGPSSTGAKSRFGFFDTWEKGSRNRRTEFADAAYRAGIEVTRRLTAG